MGRSIPCELQPDIAGAAPGISEALTSEERHRLVFANSAVCRS